MTSFRANRLPRQPGPAGWNRLLPDPPPPDILYTHETVDVAIIGAGFAGLSAARRLLQHDPGLRVKILEAGRVGDGPAGRNSGFMIDLPHDLASDSYSGDGTGADRAQTALNRTAIAFAAEIAAELNLSPQVFDSCGKVNAAASAAGDRHNRDYAAHLANLGEAHEVLDTRTMQEMTGSALYSSGLFTPGTVIIQPAAYVRALAGASAARIHECSAVRRITRVGTDWRLDTATGSVTAPRVILATNGHAESFGFFERRLMHVFTYASMTAPFDVADLPGRPVWGATPADPMGTTVRRISAGGTSRIVIRSRFTLNPTMEATNRTLARAGRLHDAKLAARFPQLAGMSMDFRWGGHLCLSRNGVPAHGEVEEGIFAAVCQNGLGTVKGTLAGLSAADLALGRPGDISKALLASPAPVKLPPEPALWAGANLYMRWKEWRSDPE